MEIQHRCRGYVNCDSAFTPECSGHVSYQTSTCFGVDVILCRAMAQGKLIDVPLSYTDASRLFSDEVLQALGIEKEDA